MISIKEIVHLVLAVIIMGFVAAMVEFYKTETLNLLNLLYFSLLFLIIVAVNVISKKISAYHHDVEIEEKVWIASRWGYYERSHLRRPIPMGIIFPFFLSILSFGAVPWYATTQYDAKPLTHRAVRRHDVYSYSELSERDLGLISATGMWSLAILAILAYIINLPDLARLSVYYAAFNMIPISQIDGAKIFFGNPIRWIIYSILALILVAYALFLV